jgi:UDP-N-acetylglucosamine 2-epimerase (non-hydrolysing)
VILESTVKPRKCKNLLEPLFQQTGKKVHIVHCPERAIPGNTLHEMVHNDRIVGCDNPIGQKIVFNLYSSFVKGEIFLTDTATAECVKLMENTCRDVNIALANEFDTVCSELGVDARAAIRLANRHPRVNILDPGPGVGGHCIAIDPLFLCEDSATACLIPTARKINDQRPDVIVRQITNSARQINVSKIGIMGIAYKKNVDDARETPALDICDQLIQQEYKVRVHDPFVKIFKYEIESSIEALELWADLLILVTDHDEYVDFVFGKPVIDTRGCLC